MANTIHLYKVGSTYYFRCRIPTLYHLGKQQRKSMTKLVNQAIAEYLSREENQLKSTRH